MHLVRLCQACRVDGGQLDFVIFSLNSVLSGIVLNSGILFNCC
jgi:hypothetical protein